MTQQPHADLVVHDIGQLASPAGTGPQRGDVLGTLDTHEQAAVAVAGDRVVAAGAEADVRAAVHTDDSTTFVSAEGGLVVPGFVDCHAHPVFAGDRAEEFDLRNRGASYEQIHAAGGGIHVTVNATRAAIADESLAAHVERHFDWMLAAGTTTAEAKSGYALTVDGEIASLDIAGSVAAAHPLTVHRTLLAAHTIPAGGGTDEAYVRDVAIPAIDAAAERGLATAVDVFLERGSFGPAATRQYLVHAQARGMTLRLHSDQFSNCGGIDLALELSARSVDHLEALSADDDRLRRLSESHTAAVLLPLSSLFIRNRWAPGRALVDSGAIVAVASDCNPGSSFGESLPLAMSLACTGCGLTASEALCAVTANAAWVLGDPDAGRIRTGSRADMLIVDQPDVRHLAYHAGTPGIQVVIGGGSVVWRGGRRV